MLVPKGNKLLLEPVVKETMIKMSESDEDKPVKGKIIALGDTMDGSEYKIGNIVYFRQFMGHNIEVEDIKYVILEAENVLCVEV